MQDEIYRPEWHLIRLDISQIRKQLRKEKLVFNAEVANVIYDAAAHVGLEMLNATVVYVSPMHVAFVLHDHTSTPYKNGKLKWGVEMLVSRICNAFSGIIHKAIAPDDAPTFCLDFDSVENASAHVASNWIHQMQNNANHCAKQDFELKTGVKCSESNFEKIPAIFRRGICLHKCPETCQALSVTSLEPHKFALSHMLSVSRSHKAKRKVAA